MLLDKMSNIVHKLQVNFIFNIWSQMLVLPGNIFPYSLALTCTRDNLFILSAHLQEANEESKSVIKASAMKGANSTC